MPVVTLTIHLETVLNVTAHPFAKRTKCLKYEPGWTQRGDRINSGQVISGGLMDDRMDYKLLHTTGL